MLPQTKISTAEIEASQPQNKALQTSSHSKHFTAVKHNEFWAPELDELNVEDTEDCTKGEDEEKSPEIEIIDRDPSCGECGENLCLSSLIENEEDSDEGFVHKFSPEILSEGYTVPAAKRMESSDYPLRPTEHKSGKTVRIYSIINHVA